MRELDICSAYHPYMLHYFISLLLELFLYLLRDGEHRRRTEGVTRMYAHRINVLYEAYRDHIIILITNHLKLQLLPAGYAFLHQYLMNDGCLQPPCTDCF